ncbi:MAG: PAS domain S-box protein [Campylobacterota bacterium]|nr:PAS domain S-box protein [Campylobacterota bacterium]
MLKISLTKRYIPALTLVAIFVIFANYLSQEIIKSNKEYAKIINISGKQRMLSQRLIILATNYHNSKLDSAKKEFVESLQDIESAHKFLLNKVSTQRLRDIYFKESLDENLINYLSNFHNLIKEDDKKYLKIAIQNSKSILIQLDLVVKEYEKNANDKLEQLSQDEFYLMLLTLFILSLEALFIFRPASIQIDKMIDTITNGKEYSDTVVESSNDAIIAIDWTAKITTYNEKAQEIFGWKKEEMMGTRNLLNIIPEKYKKIHTKASNLYLHTGKSKGILGTTVELEAIRKDGTIFPIIISFGSRYKPKGAVVVASIIDISVQKEQEANMIQQSKMASMGEMISNIAHQWRQPLSHISTLSSGALVKKEYGLLSDEEFIKTMNDIDGSVQFLSDTIDDFRNFYKVSKNKELFLLTHSINTMETIIRDSYRKNNIDIVKKIELNDIKCNGIESQLSQVFLNIFNNAKDILVEKEVETKIVYVNLSQSNDKISIKFYDNAGGVPKDILPKVFEPYFTTKEKTQGTGIGLHMSYEIIHKHFNGQISVSNKHFEVDSKEYFGACFEITIPNNVK